ncbi:MAG TPA: preprotein translocase subunit SecA [Ramlibacter sp.]|jgi:preprotein translocase subunit SecA|nr:preprotein translocase subunit SecA [Ramlibacter sp.]
MAQDAALAFSHYPERAEERIDTLQRVAGAIRYLAGHRRTGRTLLRTIVPRVLRHEAALPQMTAGELRDRAIALRPRLRQAGCGEELSAEAFALVRAAAQATLGMRHHDVQLVGGWAMLQGMLAEMETGEGKTLTATLAAATAALAGHAVHVITVNDYLAKRDADTLRPLYEALGLTVACVVHGMEPPERRAAYGSDVCYCSNKELAFDYLRDRLVLGGRPRPIAARVARLAPEAKNEPLLLRGLQFAIVDEADSVLIDEARTPLVLAREKDSSQEEALYRQALELAGALHEDDFRMDGAHVTLTPAGSTHLAQLSQGLGGIWNGPRRSERLVLQALTALKSFHRDKHYLVHEGKVQIIDENTGRLMPDRAWEQGLHQLIELKEGCALSNQRVTLARISYQIFFRRYLHLCGMTGTGSEVAGELWTVYRLRVAKIETNRPVRRLMRPVRVFARAEDKWQAVRDAIRRSIAQGRPVLVGTRSVGASEHLAQVLEREGLPFSLLNARQDAAEAEIVKAAGQPGRVTVATNMAGRGTDIKLAPGVVDAGGLLVICTERHDSGRIDRQLYGRCARQGDPGECLTFLSLEDEIVETYLPLAGRLAARLAGQHGELPRRLADWLLARAQARAERTHSRTRQDLLRAGQSTEDLLAFSGRGE